MKGLHRIRQEEGGDEIDRLYEMLAGLYTEKEATPQDALLEEQIGETLGRLRFLQAQEASRLRKTFEAGLLMPLGAGGELLQEVRQIRSSHDEDSASGNPSVRPADPS